MAKGRAEGDREREEGKETGERKGEVGDFFSTASSFYGSCILRPCVYYVVFNGIILNDLGLSLIEISRHAII